MRVVLTVAEYSALYRVHINTVRKLLQAGEIPGAIRLGRSWRIVIDDDLHNPMHL